jgi:hypothetical protein
MVFFDAHVHFHPAHRADGQLDALAERAASLAPGATPALALLDREGQNHFSAWREPGQPLDPGGRWRLGRLADPSCAVLTDGSREVLAFAGRQVAASERIEAVGLFCRDLFADGLPLADTLSALRSSGALPMLAWGIGKWLFGRAAVVAAVLQDAAPDSLLLVDSALRPTFWPEPRLMAAARRQGLRVLAGTDPLPRSCDAAAAGRYATLVDGDLDPSAPSASLRRLLLAPGSEPRMIGSRYTPGEWLRRLG